MTTYSSPNSQSTYQVPSGIQAVRLTVTGGTGADSASDRGDGGAGGRVVGRLPVTPGESLTVTVGEDGTVPAGGQSPLSAADAGDGGGDAGGGGSLSAVSDGSGTLVAVGAGGGGGGQEAGDRGGGGGGSRGGLGGATAGSAPGEDAQGSGTGGDGGDGAALGQTPGNGSAGGTFAVDNLSAVTETTSTAGPSVVVEPVPTLQTVEALDGDRIELSWTATSSVDVYRSQSPGGLSRGDYSEVATGVNSPYTDTGLDDGERYFYRIAESGGGALSNEGDATTRLPSPTALAVDAVGADSIGLSWTSNHDNGQTRVEYRPTGTSAWSAGPTVDNSTETATISGLRNGERYDLRVVATTEHADALDATNFDVAPGQTYTFSKPLDPETMPFAKPLVNAGTVTPDDTV